MLVLLDAPMTSGAGRDKSLWQRWRGIAHTRLRRAVARQAVPHEGDFLTDRGNVAQRRYYTLLTRFRPSHMYAHPATAIVTQGYVHHQPAWSTPMAQLAVTVVAGQHDDYLRVAGEEVAKELRALIAAAQP